jgi:cation diffusion facilitator family transporter
MVAGSSSKTAVVAALIGNALVAATKIAAALLTGSSAMMSEAVHSIVDTSNELLLLYGFHRANRPPDALHPLGYGRELYFWSFVVALLLFALGSGASLYQGVSHLLAPQPIESPTVSYGVLGLSFLFEGTTWWIALRRFRASWRDFGYYEAFRRSKDPPAFMVLFEDSAALIGIVIAAVTTTMVVAFDQPVWDGIGSILIGMLLGFVSAVLARESKSLLIGEPAAPELSQSVLEIVRSSPGVLQAGGLLTMQLAPDQVVAAISVEFADDSCANDIEACVRLMERHIRTKHPSVRNFFVKPQTRARHGSRRKAYERKLTSH